MLCPSQSPTSPPGPNLEAPPATLLALPCPTPLPPAPLRPRAQKKQPARTCHPALTPAGLEKVLSERGAIAIKEKLAMSESSLKSEQDRSAILGQRVRLLESDVTRLLSSLHLPSTTLQVEAPPNPPAPPACCSAQLLIPEIRRMSEQLISLQASVSAVLAASFNSPSPPPVSCPSPSPTRPQVSLITGMDILNPLKITVEYIKLLSNSSVLSYIKSLFCWGGGGTVGHDPQNKDFSNFFVYKSKNAPKT